MALGACSTREGKTLLLNDVKEIGSLPLNDSLAIEENIIRTEECFTGTCSTIKECRRLNSIQLEKKQGIRRAFQILSKLALMK